MKNYIKKLNNVSEIEERTYYKDPTSLGFNGVRLPRIIIHTIHSPEAGIHTVTIGNNPNTQEIKEQEALDYINAQGGHSLTS